MARVKCKSDIPAGSPLALLFKNATAYLLRCGAVESRVFIATGRLRKEEKELGVHHVGWKDFDCSL